MTLSYQHSNPMRYTCKTMTTLLESAHQNQTSWFDKSTLTIIQMLGLDEILTSFQPGNQILYDYTRSTDKKSIFAQSTTLTTQHLCYSSETRTKAAMVIKYMCTVRETKSTSYQMRSSALDTHSLSIKFNFTENLA